jgi:hypothetical protein
MLRLIHDGLPFLGAATPQLALTPDRLRQLLREHHVRRIFRGVYVDASVPDDRNLRCRALHLVMPRYGVLFGCSAAWALGADTFPPAERFNFTPVCVVPHGTTRCTSPYVRCVEGYLPGPDVMLVDSLRITVPVRTAADLLRRLRRPYALSAVDAMAHAALVTPAELVRYIDGLKHYPGIVQARELAVLVEPLAESPGESWQRLRLIDAGFPRPQPQFVVFDYAGREIARLDHAYPEVRVGAEYDGAEFHSHDEDRRRDESRREYLRRAMGWRITSAGQESILGKDASFEEEMGTWLGMVPELPRQW